MFSDSKISAAVKRVSNCLDFSLKDKYGKEDRKVSEIILHIHGMHPHNFDTIHNMEEMLGAGVVDKSVDPNANKTGTSIGGLVSEVAIPYNKVVGYRFLYRTMKDLYGKKEAKRLMGEMFDFSLALADSSKILLPYCFSIDASKLVVSGREFGSLPSTPPNRLSSYMNALTETVHELSNHLAGAIAIGSFFFDAAHVLMYREDMLTLGNKGVSLETLRNDKSTRKYVENCFQNFIHAVNHLSRNAVESPFTNISIFDRKKLETFLSPDNMGWYFAQEKTPLEYVVDYVSELQNIFMEIFDKGDPLNGGRNYRFPVVTLNISKDVKENGDISLEDLEFIKAASKREIYRYNILVSEGSKVASCCRLLNNFELLELGGQMNSFGGSNISLGSHRVVTVNFNRVALEASSYEDYQERLKARIESSSLILEAHRVLIKKLTAVGYHPFVDKGWFRLNRMFSTLGIMGIVEAGQTLKARFGTDADVIHDSLVLMNDKARELTVRTGNIYNIEQIPGEAMAPKLAQVDSILFGKDAVPYPMYSNQFVPLWDKATVYERLTTDGQYNKLITGGGIVHVTLGDKVTSQQAYNLIEYAAKVGCEHFALNPVYSECGNGHNTFGKHTYCPVCGGKIVEQYTRVVGFFVPVSSFNAVRRTWEYPNRDTPAI